MNMLLSNKIIIYSILSSSSLLVYRAVCYKITRWHSYVLYEFRQCQYVYVCNKLSFHAYLVFKRLNLKVKPTIVPFSGVKDVASPYHMPRWSVARLCYTTTMNSLILVIFHYYWWTASVGPRLLFSHSGLISWGLPFLQFNTTLNDNENEYYQSI